MQHNTITNTSMYFCSQSTAYQQISFLLMQELLSALAEVWILLSAFC